MAIYYPPIFINNYLSEMVPDTLPNRFSGQFRFFPTMPTDIQQLTETFPESSGDVFAVYDRMFKMRRKPFPHIKCEQLLYYFYKMAGDPDGLIETSQVVLDLLDNGDESAQDLNSWISDKLILDDDDNPVYQPGNNTNVFNPNLETFLPVFFHEIKVYQLEESRDIVDFGTARTYAGNKIIIDYDWHKS
jgi:hypothetical protein